MEIIDQIIRFVTVESPSKCLNFHELYTSHVRPSNLLDESVKFNACYYASVDAWKEANDLTH
jgi:hypothetical protein